MTKDEKEMVVAIRVQLGTNEWAGFSAHDAVAFLLDLVDRRK